MARVYDVCEKHPAFLAAHPSSRSMRSSQHVFALKIFLVIAAAIALVFLLAFLSSFKPKLEQDETIGYTPPNALLTPGTTGKSIELERSVYGWQREQPFFLLPQKTTTIGLLKRNTKRRSKMSLRSLLKKMPILFFCKKSMSILKEAFTKTKSPSFCKDYHSTSTLFRRTYWYTPFFPHPVILGKQDLRLVILSNLKFLKPIVFNFRSRSNPCWLVFSRTKEPF